MISESAEEERTCVLHNIKYLLGICALLGNGQ